MVSPDWCLASWRTSAPKSRAFSPSSFLLGHFSNRVPCSNRRRSLFSSASTVCLLLTPQPLNPFDPARVACSSPRVTRPSSLPSNTFFWRHHARQRDHLGSPQQHNCLLPFSPHPPRRIIVHPSTTRPTDQPQGRLSIAPAGTNHQHPTDRRTKRPLRRGLGDPFCASRTLCVSRVISPRCGFSPSVPRPSSHPPSVVRRPSILGPPASNRSRSRPATAVTNGPCCTPLSPPPPTPWKSVDHADHAHAHTRPCLCLPSTPLLAQLDLHAAPAGLCKIHLFPSDLSRLASKLPYPDLGPPNPSSFSCLGDFLPRRFP